MEITITLRDAGLILIGVGLIVLIVYCIIFMKNLVTTAKHANKILEDVQIVSKIAAEKSQELDKMITDAAGSISSVSDIIKGNQSVISAFTSIFNAVASAKNLFGKSK